jgi:hypothetical protein
MAAAAASLAVSVTAAGENTGANAPANRQRDSFIIFMNKISKL